MILRKGRKILKYLQCVSYQNTTKRVGPYFLPKRPKRNKYIHTKTFDYSGANLKTPFKVISFVGYLGSENH